ncbi:MAG: hypothetical protein D6723_04390 [Acidobacteria bacterium]|nr:MAG: hypothetical protein D6723_04390 [Acidobacteriota bacterium]
MSEEKERSRPHPPCARSTISDHTRFPPASDGASQSEKGVAATHPGKPLCSGLAVLIGKTSPLFHPG